MKTHAIGPTETNDDDCLYPFKALRTKQGYPSARTFQVMRDNNGESTGIQTRIDLDAHQCIARVSGHALNERRPHTLQVSSRIHLLDPWFAGLLAHSCNPNVFLDTTYLELWSVRSIKAGTLLTVDYAHTEDTVYRQFACHCGESNCRGWITGMKESLNAEGRDYVERWLPSKRP